jgi:hypothetical protein
MRKIPFGSSLSETNRKKLLSFSILLFSVAAALFFLPSDAETSVVSAQSNFKETAPTGKRARPDMLAVALDLRAAADYAVFAGSGIVETGNSQISGKKFDARGADAERASEDLTRAFAAINQLPCEKLRAPLAGGAFAPGVYCAESANLANELTLDARGDANGIFVFVVENSLRATGDLKMSLAGEARAENVFFVGGDAATIEAGAKLDGNVLTKNSIEIETGAHVKGKILSLAGAVNLSDANAGGGTGFLQICKRTPPDEPTTGAENLFNRIFRFRVGGAIYEAQTGQCTAPIELPVGAVVVEELLDGRTISGGTFNGRFKLIDVNSPSLGALGAVNLPLRTANVFVREGDANNQTIVNFVNTFAIAAVLEICKRPVPDSTNPSIQDRDVFGFFDYSIDAIPNTIYSVPAGQCSGPIQVNIPTAPGTVSLPTPVRVTELAETGYTLESANTSPADRFAALTLNKGIALNGTTVFDNPRGGYVTGTVFEGGTASQTTFNFFNRSNPARVKVCKIAGPGIPLNTRFRFTVSGLAPAYEGATPPANPNAILPGVAVTREVTVVAGPADQGGFCSFVEGTFVVGSNVTVTEQLPPLDPVPLGSNPTGDIRVSRIRVSNQHGITPTNDLPNRSTTFRVRREVVEVEYTNFVFRPTLLKICKIAGPGIPVGTPFTFDVVIENENGLFPNLSVPPVTVQAGPPSQGGFCVFAQGPYTPTNNTPPIGTFRFGSTVQVTERPATGTTVPPGGITSPTGTVLACNPANPRCGRLTLSFAGGFNEIAFINSALPCRPAEPSQNGAAEALAPECSFVVRNPFDFDGDIKADISVYGNGIWKWIRSSNGQQQSVAFGLATDKLVPSDYDGDQITDVTVYRDGMWFILQSSNGQFRAVQFGAAEDIPVPADYDGDSRTDVAVFRPSNGTWYWLQSSNGGFRAVQFGAPGDKPIIGDFDGDRLADLVVFRPANGTWYLLQSRDGFRAFQFGIAADKIVAGDYDGDGRTDFAVFRDGWWYIQRSASGFRAVQFGFASDIPVPADYNGDGKTDVAVYRAGTWHLLLSGFGEQTTYAGAQLGAAGDFPVPAIYVR